MQDRTLKVRKPLPLQEAPPGLQEAMRQLGATSWEQRGSDVIVNTGIRSVHFGKETLSRLEIHQGNPEAIAELIEENRRAAAGR
jgi:hypothetical protein